MIKPDIIANIRLYPTEEGGRRGPTPSDYWGCIFVYQNETFKCRLLLQDVGPLSPGTEAKVPIKFLSPQTVTLLTVGSQFRLREMGVIGEGMVAALVSSK